MPSPTQIAAAHSTVVRFTVAATVTGALPVPAASLAIAAENAAMIAAIASDCGVPISVATVTESLGLAATANMIGRAVFVEAARFMGWFAGPFGVAGICALGATTAGLQTWIVGSIAIAIARNMGEPIPADAARAAVGQARASYTAWRREEQASRSS